MPRFWQQVAFHRPAVLQPTGQFIEVSPDDLEATRDTGPDPQGLALVRIYEPTAVLTDMYTG